MTGRVERWARGLGSLALLVGLVVGVPTALLVLGGNPVPRRWDPVGLWTLLRQPDDGSVLARVLAVVGWLAWGVFVLSLVAELVNLARHRSREVVLPGLGGIQHWAAGLMLAVVALGAAAQLTSTVATPAVTVARAGPVPAPGSTAAAPAASAPDVVRPPGPDPSDESATKVAIVAPAALGEVASVHVVVPGDDLWSLAERYYGQGQDWRRIAAANPDLLTGGPDRLRVGWRLVVPGTDRSERSEHDEVRVRVGDTLSTIAERELGDAARWPVLYRANRAVLDDPDDLAVGVVLRVPSRADGPREPSSAPRTSDHGHARSRPTAPTETDRPPVPTGPSTPSARPGRSGSAPVSPAPASPAPVSPTPVSTGSGSPASTGPAGSAGSSAPAEVSPSALVPTGGDAGDDGETGGAGPSLLVPGLATVGGLLAASLMGGLALRRRNQLRRRPVGRRVVHPSPATRPVEIELARRARPLGLRALDRAARAVVAAAEQDDTDVPALRWATVSPERVVLDMAGPTPLAPAGFEQVGSTWTLEAHDVDALRDVPGLAQAVRPWPLLVALGSTAEGSELVVDLESRGLVAVAGAADLVTAALTAVALELACSPWTDELRLTLVGDAGLADGLASVLAQPNVTAVDDVDALLDRLDRVSAGRVRHAAGVAARTLRLDPDLAEAWTPEVVVVDRPLTPEQTDRLVRLTTARPGSGMTAVVRGPVAGAPSTVVLEERSGRLLPDGIVLVPQTLPAAGRGPVVELVVTAGSEETTPAPWWSADDAAREASGPPPDNVTFLGTRRHPLLPQPPGRPEVDTEQDEQAEQERRAAVQARMTEVADGTVVFPLLQLIGPVELLGAAGSRPARAARQCLEYCAWLLEHPAATAQEMTAGLLVAEGTRRSNMSRLRSWLGPGPDGEPYLPDAYSGRILLDPAVTSDWHQLQLLLVDGVDRAPSSVLELGLRLVRGAPLADAAPVQWHWAEEMRTDIVSCVRDLGVELARRSLESRNLDVARWSASRALVAAPGDELLLATRIRTEHLAGNAAATERLSLQLAQQARALGIDLDPATVDLIQEVMEGRLRARLA